MTRRSPALAHLIERGMLYHCSDRDQLDAALGGSRLAAVIKLTRPVAGMSEWLQFRALRVLQQEGHTPVVLLDEGAHLPRTLSSLLRFGRGSGDAVVLHTAQWRDGLRDRASSPLGARAANTSNIPVSETLDHLEVARRFGPLLRIAAHDQANVLDESLALARQLGATDLFGVTTVLPSQAGIRLESGAQVEVAIGDGSTDLLAPQNLWLSALADDVPRMLRLFTDLPLSAIRQLATGRRQDLTGAREHLAVAFERVLAAVPPADERLSVCCMHQASQRSIEEYLAYG
jgi:tyrosyl-tRNA synthetase